MASSSELRSSSSFSYKSAMLAISVAINLAFFISRTYSPRSETAPNTCMQHATELGWTRAASVEAEIAASYDCNGNGDVFVDTLHPGDDSQLLVCECYECFTGPQCADSIHNCEANVNAGDPLFFSPYWKENAESSSVLIPGWYRMGYAVIEGTQLFSLTPALEREIRSLHALVNNAVIEGRYIVLGTGSMQLLSAAVASLSPDEGDPARVVAAVPYYNVYRDQLEMFRASRYNWAGDANLHALQDSGKGPFIEFVTSPNNPDATKHKAVLNESKAIYDLAYYWPHFTAITGPCDHDVMLFTLSKVTGHAGSRIGWAIVKDVYVYKKMLGYVFMNTIGVARDSQLRATKLLRTVNSGYSKFKRPGKPSLGLEPAKYAQENYLFHYIHVKLQKRWAMLEQIFEGSKRFSLLKLDPMYCRFFEEITNPSPAYAWIRCEREDDEDCSAVFEKAGIIGRGGSAFGAEDRYVRLGLLKRDSSFEILLKHLVVLVSII